MTSQCVCIGQQLPTESGRSLTDVQLMVEIGRSQFCLVGPGPLAYDRFKLAVLLGCIPIMANATVLNSWMCM